MNNYFVKYFSFVCMIVFSLGAYSQTKADTEINTVFMFDYSFLNGNLRNNVESDTELNTEVRRARLDIKHNLKNNWKAKLQINFDEGDESSEIGDAYARYDGWEGAQLTLGKFKEPFGLENMTSSKNSTFLERSMGSNAFAPGKNKGAMMSFSQNDLNWSFALMNLKEDEGDDTSYAITSRVSWAPINRGGKLLHLGVASSLRYLNGENFEIDERAELHLSDEIIETNKIATDVLQQAVVELAWVNGPLSFQSEYFTASLEAVDASEDVDLSAYYIQASYFLTGEQRGYKGGAFSGVKPKSKKGAWEIASRYSELDTSQNSDGSKLETFSLGVNYYYDSNIRLMGNYVRTQSSEIINDSDAGQGVAFRIQYLY